MRTIVVIYMSIIYYSYFPFKFFRTSIFKQKTRGTNTRDPYSYKNGFAVSILLHIYSFILIKILFYSKHTLKGIRIYFWNILFR